MKKKTIMNDDIKKDFALLVLYLSALVFGLFYHDFIAFVMVIVISIFLVTKLFG